VRRSWLIALLLGVAALTAAVTFLSLRGAARHTTIYNPAEVSLAFSRSGLHLVPQQHFGPPDPPDMPHMFDYKPPSGLFDGRQWRGLPFIVLIAQRRPELDAASNRRVLREWIKKENRLAALLPNNFYGRRGNVVVVGNPDLSERVNHQLAEGLRSLPNRGDPTVIGVTGADAWPTMKPKQDRLRARLIRSAGGSSERRTRWSMATRLTLRGFF
jgi:hypothetical protein